MLIPELIDVAESLKIEGPRSYDKQSLIYKILDQQAINERPAEEILKKKEEEDIQEWVKEEVLVNQECHLRFFG
jgi:hypothetical protein